MNVFVSSNNEFGNYGMGEITFIRCEEILGDVFQFRRKVIIVDIFVHCVLPKKLSDYGKFYCVFIVRKKFEIKDLNCSQRSNMRPLARIL